MCSVIQATKRCFREEAYASFKNSFPFDPFVTVFQDGSMRENDPTQSEELALLIESFHDGLRQCPQLLPWLSDPSLALMDKNKPTPTMTVSADWPRQAQYLTLPHLEGEVYKDWLTQQGLHISSLTQCTSILRCQDEIPSVPPDPSKLAVDVLAPRYIHETIDAVSRDTLTIKVHIRPHTLPPPTAEEANSDWLSSVTEATSLGDCAMQVHNAVKSFFPNATCKRVFCAGHTRLWILGNQKLLLDKGNLEMIKQDFHLAQKNCLTPEAAPIVFDLMISKWSHSLHEINFAQEFEKAWKSKFSPRVCACATDALGGYGGTPNHNLGLEGDL
jgi:hypothetical protein